MEQQEIEILQRLTDQFKDGLIVKKTVIKARDIFNKYNPTKMVTYCMCTSVRRNIYARQFIEWYEKRD
jgi:hypothetical protein